MTRAKGRKATTANAAKSKQESFDRAMRDAKLRSSFWIESMSPDEKESLSRSLSVETAKAEFLEATGSRHRNELTVESEWKQTVAAGQERSTTTTSTTTTSMSELTRMVEESSPKKKKSASRKIKKVPSRDEN